MKRINRAMCLVLSIFVVASTLWGCDTVSDDKASMNTAEPYESVLATADVSGYILGENGYFEDEYICANWPSILEFNGLNVNIAQYSGVTEKGDKLFFSYVLDTGGDFNSELRSFDFNSYSSYLTNSLNKYYKLKEFDYIVIDGHTALRAVYDYAPPDEPEKLVHVLQISIGVDGWIMGLSFTSKGEIPSYCDESARNIKFKEGH